MKKILTIVEGEKADFKLMENLFQIFFGEEQYFVWAYKTNIYALYNKLELNDKDEFESLDIIRVLVSMENDMALKEKLSEKYTDIILVFDYDPQDSNFSYEKIRKLKLFFNDSTDNGKLYINYPMVEAFKHLKQEVDPEFENLKVLYKDLLEKNYKSIVNACTMQSDFKRYTEQMCLKVMKQNIQKAHKIVKSRYTVPTEKEYEQLDFLTVLDKQNQLLEKESAFYVLCTCVFFFLDYDSKYLTRLQTV